jgi:hypothetical protein
MACQRQEEDGPGRKREMGMPKAEFISGNLTCKNINFAIIACKSLKFKHPKLQWVGYNSQFCPKFPFHIA